MPAIRIRHALLLAALGATGACSSGLALRDDAIEVRLVAEGTSWHASYLVDLERRASEVATGREIHVPVGANVRLELTSRTYISDFTLPELALRDFAAPGIPSEFRFKAVTAGIYTLRGDELCGLPHTDRTRGTLVVEDSASFRAWVRGRARGAPDES